MGGSSEAAMDDGKGVGALEGDAATSRSCSAAGSRDGIQPAVASTSQSVVPDLASCGVDPYSLVGPKPAGSAVGTKPAGPASAAAARVASHLVTGRVRPVKKAA